MVRWDAARNPSATPGVLDQALREQDTAEAVAQTVDRLPEDLVERVLAHPAPQVRERAAEATTSGPLLHRLAGDTSPNVRAAVAVNPATTPDVLEQLAADPLAPDRRAAAANTALPREAVLRLARDRSADVRWNVLIHREHDAELRRLLRDDPDPAVRSAAGRPE